MNSVHNRDKVTETFRLYLLRRFWNRHCHRLKTVKKLGNSVHNRDRNENGSWGDAGSGLSLKSLPHFDSGLSFKSLSHSDSGLPLKSLSHSHHTPLVQIRNDPPVKAPKAEFLHIVRNLFASQLSVQMKSQLSHATLLWTEFLLIFLEFWSRVGGSGRWNNLYFVYNLFHLSLTFYLFFSMVTVRGQENLGLDG